MMILNIYRSKKSFNLRIKIASCMSNFINKEHKKFDFKYTFVYNITYFVFGHKWVVLPQ